MTSEIFLVILYTYYFQLHTNYGFLPVCLIDLHPSTLMSLEVAWFGCLLIYSASGSWTAKLRLNYHSTSIFAQRHLDSSWSSSVEKVSHALPKPKVLSFCCFSATWEIVLATSPFFDLYTIWKPLVHSFNPLSHFDALIPLLLSCVKLTTFIIDWLTINCSINPTDYTLVMYRIFDPL